jgi:Tol biopolymer transport system component
MGLPMKKNINFFWKFISTTLVLGAVALFVFLGWAYYRLSYPNKLFVYPTPLPSIKGLRVISHSNDYYKYPIWSPDGKTIAVIRNNKNLSNNFTTPWDSGWQIGLIDASSGKENIINLGGETHAYGHNERVVWSADSKHLIFSIVADGSKYSKWIEYSVNEEKWKWIPLTEFDRPITWKADGTVVTKTFVEQKPNRYLTWGIITWDIRTGENLTKLRSLNSKFTFDDVAPFDSTESLTRESQSISPSGQTVLMSLSDTYYCKGIWRYSLGDEKASPFIDDSEKDECDPAFSWDGSKIVYTEKPADRFSLTSDPFSPTSLVIANADGSSPKTWAFPGLVERIRYPTWSPNGKQIAFAYGRFDGNGTNLVTQIIIVDVPPELQPIQKP